MLIIKHVHDEYPDESLWFFEIDKNENIIWTEDKENAYQFEELLIDLSGPSYLAKILDQIVDEEIFPITLEKVSLL